MPLGGHGHLGCAVVCFARRAPARPQPQGQKHDPGAVLLPTISTGFTDSHYARAAFGSTAYGLWPARSTPWHVAAAGVHGHDERIHGDDLGYATQFHIEVCRSLLASEDPPADGL